MSTPHRYYVHSPLTMSTLFVSTKQRSYPVPFWHWMSRMSSSSVCCSMELLVTDLFVKPNRIRSVPEKYRDMATTPDTFSFWSVGKYV